MDGADVWVGATATVSGFTATPDAVQRTYGGGLTDAAVDHQVAVLMFWAKDYDDRRLLATLSQRRHQLALPARLADPQMFPAPVELVKLQLHRRLLGVQYARCPHWSFAAEREVRREVLWNQPDTAGTGLSRSAPLVLP